MANHHTEKYAISYQWGISYLVLKNTEIVMSLSLSVTAYIGRSTGRSTPQVLTSSGQEWQFHIAIVTAHIDRSTGRSTPQSIEHRCLEYHYTKLNRCTGRSTPCQSSIDALKTITPNMANCHTEKYAILYQQGILYPVLEIQR